NGTGVIVNGQYNVWEGNIISSNSGIGFQLADTTDHSTFISNSIYSNGSWGFEVRDFAVSSVLVGGALGYDALGNSHPDGAAEVRLDTSSNENITLRDVHVNPSPGILNSGFIQAGNYLVSYNQSFATGTVLVYGDYTVSGSTITLDYSAVQLHATASPP